MLLYFISFLLFYKLNNIIKIYFLKEICSHKQHYQNYIPSWPFTPSNRHASRDRSVIFVQYIDLLVSKISFCCLRL